MGEKTATKWIPEYGSLQALVDNVDAVKGKVGDALRAHLSSVILNRELTDLVKDVPLAQTPDTLRMQPWDRDQIHRLFDDLEFRVLRDRLFDTLAPPIPRSTRVSTCAAARWSRANGRGVAGRHAADGRRGRAWPWSDAPARSTPTPPRSRSPPPTATAATSTPPR